MTLAQQLENRGILKGMQQGMRQGMHLKTSEIAKKLLMQKMAVKLIAEATDLTIAEV